MAEQVDVVVVGLGPGGEHVAEELAGKGLRVVGVEKNLVGGECPYWGCVPSKMMIRAADLLAEAGRVNGMAGEAVVKPDWAPVARRIREEATDFWNDKVAVERFEKKGGILARGAGRLERAGVVSVDGREFEAERGVVLATGTRPAMPAIAGLDDVPYWTNHEAIECDVLPRSLVVIGGGAIGLELAQVFARFGVEVTVIEVGERPLMVEEPEAGDLLREVFTKEGIKVLCNHRTTAVDMDRDAFVVSLEGGKSVRGEKLLVATGRHTNLDGLGLENVGLDPKARFVDIDGQTRAGERLYAIGDITGKGMFTHISMYQADIAIADILGKPGPPGDYRSLPRVTFTDPEVGAAGMTEKQARDKGLNVRIGHADNSASTRGWIHGPGNEGLIKLVEDADEGVLVGATCAAARGGEMMSMLALAIHERIPTERLRHMIYAYPTFYRGIEAALKDLQPKA
ncbi:MAG: hypothetical protein QOE92_893 [Chloroflexota bacterium]|nr:hypothetical protein [Chloroflexota bacterium]